MIPAGVTREAPVQEKEDSVQILPYKSTGITEALAATAEMLSRSVRLQIAADEREKIRAETDTLQVLVSDFLRDTALSSLEDATMRDLELFEQRSSYFISEIDKLDQVLSRRALELENELKALDLNRKQWELTLEEGRQANMLQERMRRIDRTLERIDSVRTLLSKDMRLILGLQDRILDWRNQLKVVAVSVSARKSEVGQMLLTLDQPHFFRALKGLGDNTLMPSHRAKLERTWRSDLDILKKEFSGKVIAALVFLVLLLMGARWITKNLDRVVDPDQFKIEGLRRAILDSRIASCFFLFSVLVVFLIPDLPITFHHMNMLVMNIALVTLVMRLFGSGMRNWMLVMLGTTAVYIVYVLTFHQGIYARMMLLFISLAGVWLFAWLQLRQAFASDIESLLIRRLYQWMIRIFLVLEVVSFGANLVGAFQLAEFFALLPLRITVLAIAVIVATHVADTLIFIFLAGRVMQRLNAVREEMEVIHRKTLRLIDLLLWLYFFIRALDYFRLKEAIFAWAGGILTNGFKIGAVEITLANILILVVVVWLSIVITRIITRVVEKDVFTRVTMAKGVPSTIVLLLRILLISAGMFLAMAAAGMELTNLSIVLGAFSVGIGFGLQNIFNNMVSGLILAFERPIKVGDIVQVGELLGVVTSIGLRSSTVRSFDGAEVIVPNGNLISDQMINWTKSDSHRRMDIRAGVAYGTDPEQVIAIMLEVAHENGNVWKEPPPRAYFINFGESSLDFRLLAWCHIDNRLETESALLVEINRRLKEAGIEIPFPQRDIHLRSDHTKGAAS